MGRIRAAVVALASLFASGCELTQTARWPARENLTSLVRGVALVREEFDL